MDIFEMRAGLDRLEQCYNEGYDAYFAYAHGYDLRPLNPYNGVNEDAEWDAWNRGYEDAQYND